MSVLTRITGIPQKPSETRLKKCNFEKKNQRFETNCEESIWKKTVKPSTCKMSDSIWHTTTNGNVWKWTSSRSVAIVEFLLLKFVAIRSLSARTDLAGGNLKPAVSRALSSTVQMVDHHRILAMGDVDYHVGIVAFLGSLPDPPWHRGEP